MILAWVGALIIGVTLGLLGSGGSILTVPVLVYLVGQDPKVAMAGSLMIVALISIFAAWPYARQKTIDWRMVGWFGIPGLIGAAGGAWLAHFIDSMVQMLIFAALMLSAAYLMFKPIDLNAPPKGRANYKIVADGLMVGALTGLVGVGGGFLIIPALILLGGLSMRLAVGTSLVIIVLKSLVGFVVYLDVLAAQDLALDWPIIIKFSLIGILGGWLGHKISHKFDQQKLRQFFAVFLVLMSLFILYQKLPGLVMGL
ncbi:sulfite exporter TauE/SafE family protein [Thiomicrospira sp. R3]|uniref:sulfite exporter TauE/SafE family protein n=1 Tax=Thiomicrospira sp. R3 TaxID=3035472 RepID=UPI00259B056A|nr:sulfite exporter TauE/SafE family protein [Thiomicrospira sp. R3]WFE69401.1 sulfite exporter TauE/SafE family protein [Thiomicrospira sp. R3]